MSFIGDRISLRMMAASSSPRDAASHTKIVEDERQWRALPPNASTAASGSSVVVTRWCALTDQTREVKADTAEDFYVVKIVLRNTNLRLSVSGRTVQDGLVTAGMFHVTEPAAPVRGVFSGPYDVLHLHVPRSLVAECVHDMPGRQQSTLSTQIAPKSDPTMERLARALLGADQIGGQCGRLYTDCIGVAVVARLLVNDRRAAVWERAKTSGLAPWRLKRAVEYVETRLAEPVSLADIASAAGLTRMYFAAQFRAATGLRPHEYLLRRRIERAQEMLIGSDMSLVDVALSVGFQSQPHFTSVFKRFVGQPPNRWCESQERRNFSLGQ